MCVCKNMFCSLQCRYVFADGFVVVRMKKCKTEEYIGLYKLRRKHKNKCKIIVKFYRRTGHEAPEGCRSITPLFL